jgi:hypothetical protein
VQLQSIKDYFKKFDCEEIVHFLPFNYHREKSDTDRFAVWLHTTGKQESSDVLFMEEDKLKTLATKLDWDTDFFKKQIWKIQVASWNNTRQNALLHLQEVERKLKRRGGQYIFIFAPALSINIIDVLGRNGWSVIESRGLLYRELNNISDISRYPVVPAGESDVMPLSRVAVEVVNPYDRFHSDDYFDKNSVDAFMKKWVENSILHKFAADTVLRPASGPDAFLSIDHRKDLYQFGIKDTQMVLSAVNRTAKGWFFRLISETAHIAREMSSDYISLTTQMNNIGAIKTCQRLNMKIAETQLVLRKVLQ